MEDGDEPPARGADGHVAVADGRRRHEAVVEGRAVRVAFDRTEDGRED